MVLIMQCLRELGISPTTTPTAKPPTPPHCQTPDYDTILQQLATTKIQHAETLHLLELKSMELKGAVQRERKLRETLEQTRESQKNKDDHLSFVTCPHCGASYCPSKEEDQQSFCPSQNEDNSLDTSLTSLKTVDTLLPMATPTTPDSIVNNVIVKVNGCST